MHVVRILPDIILAVLLLRSGLLIRNRYQRVGIIKHLMLRSSSLLIIKIMLASSLMVVYKKVNLRLTWKFRNLKCEPLLILQIRFFSSFYKILFENLCVELCSILKLRWIWILCERWKLWIGNSFLEYCFEDNKRSYAVPELSWNHCSYQLGRRWCASSIPWKDEWWLLPSARMLSLAGDRHVVTIQYYAVQWWWLPQ